MNTVTPAPLVSVIMPVFKPRFLATAIDSVLAQTVPDFELILINDGSPDSRVRDIARDYQSRDARVSYIEQENAGLAKARNNAAEKAAGKFLMWMDDDDISLPERIDTQVNFLRAHPDVAAVRNKVRGILADGSFQTRKGKPLVSPLWSETIIRKTPPKVCDCDPIILSPAVMVRASAFRAVNFRPIFRVFEDYEWGARLEESFAVGFSPEIVYLYRNSKEQGRLTRRDDGYLSRWGIETSIFFRRRENKDPAENAKTLGDVLRFIPQLPKQSRRKCINAWRKSARKRLAPENYSAIKDEIARYGAMFSADVGDMRRAQINIWLTAFYRGRWGFFTARQKRKDAAQ